MDVWCFPMPELEDLFMGIRSIWDFPCLILKVFSWGIEVFGISHALLVMGFLWSLVYP